MTETLNRENIEEFKIPEYTSGIENPFEDGIEAGEYIGTNEQEARFLGESTLKTLEGQAALDRIRDLNYEIEEASGEQAHLLEEERAHLVAMIMLDNGYNPEGYDW